MHVLLDANLFIALVLPLPYSNQAVLLYQSKRQAGSVVAAPSLWSYEVGSALRKALVHRLLERDELDRALEHLWNLGVQEVPQTLWMQRQSLAWAERLGRSKAYDSAYLAAAKALQAEFWTADSGLAKAAKAAGAAWAHCIDEWNGESRE
jgi:predicted nucleic acid-binding protein